MNYIPSEEYHEWLTANNYDYQGNNVWHGKHGIVSTRNDGNGHGYIRLTHWCFDTHEQYQVCFDTVVQLQAYCYGDSSTLEQQVTDYLTDLIISFSALKARRLSEVVTNVEVAISHGDNHHQNLDSHEPFELCLMVNGGAEYTVTQSLATPQTPFAIFLDNGEIELFEQLSEVIDWIDNEYTF